MTRILCGPPSGPAGGCSTESVMISGLLLVEDEEESVRPSGDQKNMRAGIFPMNSSAECASVTVLHPGPRERSGKARRPA